MSRARLTALLFALAASAAAAAQTSDDAPIPYPDDVPEIERRPRGDGDLPATRRKESDRDVKNRERSLASLDDPNLGVAFELTAGLMLLDSSRGGLVDPRFAGGARFTWEIGRLARNVWLRDRLFLDFSYVYTGARTGTRLVYGDSNYHDFTAAPALGMPLGRAPVVVYAQVGGGAAYQHTALHLDGAETRISGLKPLLQYGVGLRARPALTLDEAVRLVIRVEATRFRRGYMDDTLFAGSLGLVF